MGLLIRVLERNGVCSSCGKGIKPYVESVVTIDSKKHTKLIVICNDCKKLLKD